jgi:flavin reductase (DIM6/NTAB) family NADH-FMN oxidoreductase RutF
MLEISPSSFSLFLHSHPVLLVSSRHARSSTLAPVTWYVPLSNTPPLIGLSLKPSTMSYHYIREAGDFLLAVPPAYMAKVVHFCGIHSGRDMDKFRYLNFGAFQSKSVSAFRVAGAVCFMECRLRQISRMGDRPFLCGEIVHLSVDPRYGDEKGWHDKVELVYHRGGNRYQVNGKELDLSDYRPGYIPPDSIGMDLCDVEIDIQEIKDDLPPQG